MKKAILAVLLLGALAGCSNPGTAIQGDWQVDLERMVKSARQGGASEKAIADIEEGYANGVLHIDDKTIRLGVTGTDQAKTLNYEMKSRDGGCVRLSINASTQLYRYCVVDGRLAVHDPETKRVLLFKKA